MPYTTHYNSPLGKITMWSDGTALTGLWFDGQRHFPATVSGCTSHLEDLDVFRSTRLWLDTYFNGEQPGFTPTLLLCGTPFRQQVWQKLLAIPYGKTITYGAIAKAIALERGIPSMSAQAIGGAVGHNPVSLIVPCHRVIGADSALTGYAGGIDRKKWLLQLEGAIQ